WSHEPWSLDWMRNYDLDIDVSAARFSVWGFDLGDARLQLQTADRQATLKALTGRLFGGAFSASGALDARNTPAAKISVDLKGGSLEQTLRALTSLKGAGGKLDASLKAAASGASEADMIASSQAVATLLVEDGEFQDIDLPRLADQASGLP